MGGVCDKSHVSESTLHTERVKSRSIKNEILRTTRPTSQRNSVVSTKSDTNNS